MKKLKKIVARGTCTVEHDPDAPVRVRFGRHTVTRNLLTREGLHGGSASACGDVLTEIHVLDGRDLSARLEELARVFGSTRDDLDGAASVFVLRRYSSDFVRGK